VYEFETGDVFAYDPKAGQFLPLTAYTTLPIDRAMTLRRPLSEI
jgi:hypothetical protein